MALRYKARRRLALLVLLVGLPIYVVAAVNLVDWLGRASFWVELCVYLGLGLLWMLPLKAVFTGIGQPDPDAASQHQGDQR